MKRLFWVCLLVLGLILSWTLVYAADFYVVPVVKEKKNYAPVEKTGQWVSDIFWDDGWIQAGVTWPYPRFTDNNNGTVTDNLTGLIWMKRANCLGISTWWESETPVEGSAVWDCFWLESGDCDLNDGSVVGQWRLPNLKELYSLINLGHFDPAVPNTSGTGKWTEGDPFVGVHSGSYWSSTTNAANAEEAWAVSFYKGIVGAVYKNTIAVFVWCVRDGN